jgi:hypothetical protein
LSADEVIADLGLEEAARESEPGSRYDCFFRGMIVPLHNAIPTVTGEGLDGVIRRLFASISLPSEREPTP